MARDDRKKASDVFRESNYPFAKKVTLGEAFPMIADIQVQAKEIDYGNVVAAHWSGGKFVDCTNPLCFNGGFSVQSCVRAMVNDGAIREKFTGLCQGYEGSPKGRRKTRACMHAFEVEIEIEYKDVSEESSEEEPPRDD